MTKIEKEIMEEVSKITEEYRKATMRKTPCDACQDCQRQNDKAKAIGDEVLIILVKHLSDKIDRDEYDKLRDEILKYLYSLLDLV